MYRLIFFDLFFIDLDTALQYNDYEKVCEMMHIIY